MHEEDIGGVLRGALPEETPLRPDLHLRARAQGRQRRLRHRMATAGATAALVAVGGTAMALSTGGSSGPRSLDVGVAASGSPTAVASGPPSVPYQLGVKTDANAAAAIAAIQNDLGSQGTLKLLSEVVDGRHWTALFTLAEPGGARLTLSINIEHGTAAQIGAMRQFGCPPVAFGCVGSVTTTTLPDGTETWAYGGDPASATRGTDGAPSYGSTPTKQPPTSGSDQSPPTMYFIPLGHTIGFGAASKNGGYILDLVVSAQDASPLPAIALLQKIGTDPAVVSAGLSVAAQ